MRMKMETLSDEMRDLAEPHGVLNQEGLQCEKERKKTCDDLNKAFMDSSAPSNHGE